MNENVDGGSFIGFLYRMAMPKFMNDGVKSMAATRSDVIVKSVMAKSARCQC